MIVLAFEFSSPARAVAIVEVRDGHFSVLIELVDRDFRNRGAVGLVQDVLARASLKPEQIDRLAVGLGPGSYTGVRSAISIAQGWQLACGTPAVGIGSMEILAATAFDLGWRETLTLAIDAQRTEVCTATYDLSGKAPSLLTPSTIAPAASLVGQSIAGPEASQWSTLGRELLPSAVLLARLGAGADPVPAEKLEPIYLRPVAFVKAPPARVLP